LADSTYRDRESSYLKGAEMIPEANNSINNSILCSFVQTPQSMLACKLGPS